MTSDPPVFRPATEPAPEEREWLAIAAHTFVIIALIALAVTPNLVLDRVTEAA